VDKQDISMVPQGVHPPGQQDVPSGVIRVQAAAGYTWIKIHHITVSFSDVRPVLPPVLKKVNIMKGGQG
jgi:hypothetical protein